ncbi:MAG: group II truncated hemoglobin [Candidatus Thiodiazotropha sp. (ex. Lucinisca nassula)]|nr:group II truncated hemoglobin [Candidatus Thiodiazotropha sp. (ex. Lucinisca nassula)]
MKKRHSALLVVHLESPNLSPRALSGAFSGATGPIGLVLTGPNISREKLFLFLSGWLGGPDLYVEKYGHPRLRARHLPFSIGIEERDQWIYCMREALSAMDLDAKLQEELNQAFFRTADFMRNRDEEVRDTPFRIISSGKTQ